MIIRSDKKNTIMNYLKICILACLVLAMGTACEDLVDDINDNPNEITADDVDARLFLTGAQLANIQVQVGHLNRISGMYSGQLVGLTSLYSNIYGYSLSGVESNGVWSRIYVGALTNTRLIREKAPDDRLLNGIAKVIEAHAIGTGASLFGDLPYSEANNTEIEDPAFDSQISVFNAVIDLLTDAISDLEQANSRLLLEDIYFEGDAQKWLEAAYTLQARYYLQLRDYGNAYAAAQQGISSADGNMLFIPRGPATNAEGDKNLFWMILAGSRTGDIGTGDSYLMQILDESSDVYRGNDKTDETARFNYYTIDETSANGNRGVIEQFEPQPMVTYEENQLILAEAGTRTQGLETGLGQLNELRSYLTAGGRLNANFSEQPILYETYVADDFAAGGLENMDNVDQETALLREIIEERYVSGFGTYIPFNDARRLRASDPDLVVPFPFNTQTATNHPERLPYSANEINTNDNAPSEPGIFAKTEVNQ
jgi:hypothetical protein